MNSPVLKGIIQSVLGILVFAAIIYFSAGTWNYWQGWNFLAVFTFSTVSFSIYLFLYDRPLMERRMNAGPWKENERSQKVIVSLIILAFFACMVFPILDYRFNLSRVPAYASIIGDAIILLSFLGIFLVIKFNSWAASNINVEEGQTVIDTGPYAYVRHPMYAFALWLFVGIPLSLGSWWTIMLVIPVFPVLLWRLLDEERILKRDLPGYIDYTQKVRTRFVPYVW
jgi:protein-S-isoprenylcysteine O-methyltransferase Ste14